MVSLALYVAAIGVAIVLLVAVALLARSEPCCRVCGRRGAMAEGPPDTPLCVRCKAPGPGKDGH